MIRDPSRLTSGGRISGVDGRGGVNHVYHHRIFETLVARNGKPVGYVASNGRASIQ
jgi:hypothetical protein